MDLAGARREPAVPGGQRRDADPIPVVEQGSEHPSRPSTDWSTTSSPRGSGPTAAPLDASTTRTTVTARSSRNSRVARSPVLARRFQSIRRRRVARSVRPGRVELRPFTADVRRDAPGQSRLLGAHRNCRLDSLQRRDASDRRRPGRGDCPLAFGGPREVSSDDVDRLEGVFSAPNLNGVLVGDGLAGPEGCSEPGRPSTTDSAGGTPSTIRRSGTALSPSLVTETVTVTTSSGVGAASEISRSIDSVGKANAPSSARGRRTRWRRRRRGGASPAPPGHRRRYRPVRRR